MEINERFLTLLTPEGEFLRARKFNSHYQIGQEIDFLPIAIEEEKKPFFLNYFQNLRGKAIFAAALLMMLVIASFLPFYGKNEVYAYMSIDVNPSIELGVNEEFQVVEIFPYNKDGQKIIANIHNWKKKKVHVLANEILQEIKEQGYMKNSQEIVIATVNTNEGFKEQNNKLWEKEIAEIKAEIHDENLQLKVVKGSKIDRDQAKEIGLTTGLYKKEQLKASHTKEKSNNVFKKTETDNNQMMNSTTSPGHQKKDKASGSTPSLENQANQNSQNEKYNHKQDNNKEKNKKEQNNKVKNNKENNNKESRPNKENQNNKQNDKTKQDHNASQKGKEKQNHDEEFNKESEHLNKDHD